MAVASSFADTLVLTLGGLMASSICQNTYNIINLLYVLHVSLVPSILKVLAALCNRAEMRICWVTTAAAGMRRLVVDHACGW